MFNINLTKTISRCSNTFKIIPYSNDISYKFLNIKAEDNSGIRHISKNGNVWLTCNCPKNEGSNIVVSLKGGVIDKPKKGFLFFQDRQFFSRFLRNPIIFGKIRIEADVFDITNISKVEFFIDEGLQFEDREHPFEWIWDEYTFSKHSLMLKSYYKDGFISEDIMDLWKFF
jgi:hypothetical protein